MSSLTSEEIIDALGGTRPVASELQLALSVVSGWKKRGIPAKRWPDFVRLATEKGCKRVTFETLAGLPERRELRA